MNDFLQRFELIIIGVDKRVIAYVLFVRNQVVRFKQIAILYYVMIFQVNENC